MFKPKELVTIEESIDLIFKIRWLDIEIWLKINSNFWWNWEMNEYRKLKHKHIFHYNNEHYKQQRSLY